MKTCQPICGKSKINCAVVISSQRPMALRLPKGQAVAIAMEIGIHNAALAIFIALNVLRNPAAAVVPGIYSLVMDVTASAFAVWLLRRNAAPRTA